MKWALLAFAPLAFACGGTTNNPLDDGGADALQDAPKDTAPDVAPDASGPLTCGSTTCQGTDLCVHPCCGGIPPPCVPYEDGGTCPTGYVPSSQCTNLQTTQGCVPAPCTPPPPYCTPATSGACPSYDQLSGRNCYEFCA